MFLHKINEFSKKTIKKTLGKKEFFLLVVAMNFLFLAGCAENYSMLGMTSQDFEKYDDTKREQLFTNYEKIQQLQKNQVRVSSKHLALRIFQGKIAMPPDFEYVDYKPFSLIVYDGTCKETNVLPNEKLKDNNGTDNTDEKEISTSLVVCYKNNLLYIDPTRYELSRPYGTITLNSSPFWEDGFTYTNINTFGYAKLKNVSITVNQK